MMRDFIKTALSYVRRHLAMLAAVIIAAVIFYVVFSLYDLPTEPVVYSCVLTAVGFAFIGAVRFSSFYSKHMSLTELKTRAQLGISSLPEPSSVLEADYQEIIARLDELRSADTLRYDRFRGEMTDYYTMWAHQIKTPIAAMRLLLQSDEGAGNAELQAELLKIEQYVEMVLGYLRLDSDSTDYVLREFSLDDIIRQSVRKYARLFILKKLSLDFRETGMTVITDEKWLTFVIEQLLSNALKYTREGSISIYSDDGRLIIEDTGIGIKAEDIPRVFEKGFTGYNGRLDKKSTGIGLYLCRRIVGKLGQRIALDSREGVGTRVMITMDTAELAVD